MLRIHIKGKRFIGEGIGQGVIEAIQIAESSIGKGLSLEITLRTLLLVPI